ncbi:sodium/proline symporter [Maribacter sp.]|uniref:sodium/proline symporter n=1 Tax=Maribacter sp. TaxID=1897614 RepID=UPI0025BAF18F|nr:sodium/proline symporter [Maribacter sp.]
MEKTTVIIITLLVYKVLLIGIGIWSSRRTKSNTDYFLGGRNLGPVVAAISYSASSSSAWTLLGMSGAAYVLGLSAIWIVLGCWLGVVLAWYYVAPKMRKYSAENNNITVIDFVAHKTTGTSRSAIVIVSSIIILISFAFYVAAQFQGAGSTLSTTFNMSVNGSIILGGLVIMIYTFLGGFWAVSITDTVQGVLMAITALILPTAAIISIGGFDALFEGLRATADPEYLSLSGKNTGLAVIGFAAGSLGIGFGPVGQPHLLVRFMALRDDKSVRQARVLTVVWFLIVFTGMLILGLAGQMLIPGLEGAAVETVFFELTNRLFSPLWAAIIIAAVLSAIMSTADSQLLVGASSISHDLGLGNRFPKQRLLISRLAIAVVVIASIIISIYVPATIFDRALFAWSALGAAFGPIVIFKLSGFKYSGKIILLAILVGFVLAVIFFMLPNTIGDYVERIIPFVAGSIILWATRKRKQN